MPAGAWFTRCHAGTKLGRFADRGWMITKVAALCIDAAQSPLVLLYQGEHQAVGRHVRHTDAVTNIPAASLANHPAETTRWPSGLQLGARSISPRVRSRCSPAPSMPAVKRWCWPASSRQKTTCWPSGLIQGSEPFADRPGAAAGHIVGVDLAAAAFLEDDGSRQARGWPRRLWRGHRRQSGGVADFLRHRQCTRIAVQIHHHADPAEAVSRTGRSVSRRRPGCTPARTPSRPWRDWQSRYSWFPALSAR